MSMKRKCVRNNWVVLLTDVISMLTDQLGTKMQVLVLNKRFCWNIRYRSRRLCIRYRERFL